MNDKLWARIYLTSRRLITITVFPSFGGLKLGFEFIIELERIYRLEVDEDVLKIDFKKIERYERDWILLQLWNSDIERWKNEIIRLRNIRIKHIEDH